MPDFENLRKALLCRGEPERVTLFEGTIAEGIRNQFLSKPIGGLQAEVEFHMKAGWVEEEVKLRIRTIAPGGGYCCGASNSFPKTPLAVNTGRGGTHSYYRAHGCAL